jgi:hypothetical protein
MKSEVSERDSVIRRRMFITDRLLQMKNKGPTALRPRPTAPSWARKYTLYLGPCIWLAKGAKVGPLGLG